MDIYSQKKSVGMLGVGTDLFQVLREQNGYFVDKTMFIKSFLENRGHVNLITRPRRFGKTINLSMLKSFFEIGSNTSLFQGLNILNLP